MKSVGKILQETRLGKKITLEQVAAQTKIRQDVLMALEADDLQRLSSVASTKGFLKSYAEFLDLPSPQILAFFRRDFSKKEKKKVMPSGLFKPVVRREFDWTPKKTMIAVIALFFIGLAGWLIFQYLSLIRPPSLKIISPISQIQVNQETIEVVGRADPDSLVTVNKEIVLLSPNGEFRHQITLFPGENDLVIEATSKLGKKTSVERTVFYQPND
ncbi:helix-turn-helix domain-containing protein [Patescibacteria group bacterium]|nr:helix-turn-helix domain-containing protein [Patescibacteria group bacterium]